MRFLRGFLWLLGLILVLVVAAHMTATYDVAERLTGLFLIIQSWLPLTLEADQFLIVVTVASLLMVAVILTACMALLGFMAVRLSVARQKQLGQVAAAKREVEHVKEQHQRHYDQLIALGHVLTKRLDKRVLVQAIVEAASRITSSAQANSIIGLWLLKFETDTIGFDMGLYCDGAMFRQIEFQLTEPPFARVIASKKPWLLPAGIEAENFLKPECLPQLGSVTGLMVIPLVIEESTLGILTVFCHPDILKSYEEQRLFYDAMWEELALGLAIAIQGEMAILDRLTGTHNREYFMKRLIQEIERANRYQLPLMLLMIDIDNFKLVNDMLGHPQGDAVLKIVAKLIRKEVRAIDLVGRYGGEEFIVMLPETGYGEEGTGASGSLVVAERIRKAVDDEFSGLQKPLNLTVSVGVTVRRFPENREQDYRDLIRLADEQLYRAKTTGKNKVCILIPEKPQEVP